MPAHPSPTALLGPCLRTLLIASLLWLAGQASAHDALPPGTDWLDGDVGRALSQAAAQDRPVFLYWGAAWCPPCNQLKSVLFRRSDFQQRMRSFVPVYLDGDGEAAQRWGERFRVVGYPTLLVLDARGDEIARLAGDTEPERLLRVLDNALQRGHPLADLAGRAERGETLGAPDWQLLASEDWQADAEQPAAQLALRLAGIARRAPDDIRGLRARFWLLALAQRGEAAFKWDASDAGPDLLDLLGDEQLTRSNRDLLMQSPFQALRQLAPTGSARAARLADAWGKALQRLSADEALTCSERLHYGYYHEDLLLAGQDPSPHRLPAPVIATARGLVAACDQATRDPVERQTVVNSASRLLQQSGLPDEAAALLEAEIPRAHAPEYFLLDRAQLADDMGQGAEAIEWSGLAYAATAGGATRLQWGCEHLRYLGRHSPQRHAAIAGFAALLLREAQRLPDAFADRNLRSLRQIRTLLAEWAKAHPPLASEQQALRTAWQSLCAQAPTGDPRVAELCHPAAGSS